MFFTSFSISHRSVLACHFFVFVFCLNCCNLPYCNIFSNLVFFTDIFISHYVTYVCLLRLMPLSKTCFDCIFIPLHLTKWAVAHESLCSNKKQSTLVHNVLFLSFNLKSWHGSPNSIPSNSLINLICYTCHHYNPFLLKF